jgi:hypothetical protein
MKFLGFFFDVDIVDKTRENAEEFASAVEELFS